MAKMSPVHSSRDYEEDDPKFHDDDKCPHYHELVRNDHVKPGKGGHKKCKWCKKYGL